MNNHFKTILEAQAAGYMTIEDVRIYTGNYLNRSHIVHKGDLLKCKVYPVQEGSSIGYTYNCDIYIVDREDKVCGRKLIKTVSSKSVWLDDELNNIKQPGCVLCMFIRTEIENAVKDANKLTVDFDIKNHRTLRSLVEEFGANCFIYIDAGSGCGGESLIDWTDEIAEEYGDTILTEVPPYMTLDEAGSENYGTVRDVYKSVLNKKTDDWNFASEWIERESSGEYSESNPYRYRIIF